MSGHAHAPSAKSVNLILIATFLFGFITGVILFLQNNTGNQGDGGIIETPKEGFTILAYAYGGCERVGCPAYRIGNNGAYTYIVRTVGGLEERFEDTLTTTQRGALRNALAMVDFDALDDTEFTGTCPITYDGLAYQYDIEYNGERYEVDTCVEAVDDQPLFEILEKYFELFQLTHEVL